jgi:glycerophosphoryl diester phosphodiesterase
MYKWFFIISVAPFLCFSQSHINAHAHNDYEHRRPLFDALQNGFTSIEADVHLVDGKLLVSHDRPTTSARTLEDLYLKPLDSISKANGASIYREQSIPILLMIDIKTEGDETFKALQQVLLLHIWALDFRGHKGAYRVVISGNRPVELIRNEPPHLSAIDGRPEDLGKGFSTDEMPVVSENYKKIINWNGKGRPSQAELDKVIALAAKVHGENKKLRLWGIPDNENAWNVLLQAGVDLINTDKLEELNMFLTEKKL